MKYEKPNLEEMDLMLEGSFLNSSTTTFGVGLDGQANGNPWA